MSENEDRDMVQPPVHDEEPPAMTEEEGIRRQKKQFMIFAIAGIVMLVVAFFAGRAVKEWVSEDSAPIMSPAAVEVVIDEA